MCRDHVPSESQESSASHDRTLTHIWQLTRAHHLVCATAFPVLNGSPVSQNMKEANCPVTEHHCFSVACCWCSVAGEVGNCSVFLLVGN